MIGRYLDALAKAGEWDAIDRVIQAQQWCNGTLFDGTGARCIRGWVHDVGDYEVLAHRAKVAGDVTWETATRLNRLAFPFGYVDDRKLRISKTVPTRYNRLHQRYGDRLIRAIKQRAGEWTRPEVPASCDVRENAHA